MLDVGQGAVLNGFKVFDYVFDLVLPEAILSPMASVILNQSMFLMKAGTRAPRLARELTNPSNHCVTFDHCI